MRELGITDAAKLQAYFTQRIARFLAANGRRLVGWDEILEPGPAAGRGGDVLARHRRRDRGGRAGPRHGARRAADALLRQPPGARAPTSRPGRGTSSRCEDVYAFEPMPAGDRAGRSAATCSACRATCGPSTSAPRSAWRTWRFRARRRSPSSAGRSPSGATGRTSCAALSALSSRATTRCGLPYADSAFAVNATVQHGRVRPARVELATPGRLRRRSATPLDGSEPTARSPRYRDGARACRRKGDAARRRLRRRTRACRARARSRCAPRDGAAAHEPGAEAVQRAHRALARGRRAARGHARGVPGRHQNPCWIFPRRGPRRRRARRGARRPGAVQLPDRRGREEDPLPDAARRAEGELEVRARRLRRRGARAPAARARGALARA